MYAGKMPKSRASFSTWSTNKVENTVSFNQGFLGKIRKPTKLYYERVNSGDLKMSTELEEVPVEEKERKNESQDPNIFHSELFDYDHETGMIETQDQEGNKILVSIDNIPEKIKQKIL